jgi:hypothetical protein
MSYDHVVTKRLRLAGGRHVLGIVRDNRGASDHRPIWAVLVDWRIGGRTSCASHPSRCCSSSRRPARAGHRDPPAGAPAPDLERAEWVNLNGDWSFRFDKDGKGEGERWFESAPAAFPLTIHVPFPWGSKLSGVPDEADVAWYARTIRVPESWKGKRVFLVVGASDWKTSGWLDGQPIGGYQGGYTPFELELTKAAKPGQDQRLVLRVDDTPHAFKLEGKQGYGKARGLWQTAYLEARPAVYVDSFEVHPSLAEKRVELRLRLSDPAPAGRWRFYASPPRRRALPRSRRGRRSRPARARRGSRCRSARARGCGRSRTRTSTTRRCRSRRLRARTGEDVLRLARDRRREAAGPRHPYVSLNGKPLYLQLTLDQGWHPDGFYTWPSDAAMREEVLIARRLGLNAIRTHVKVELPRKLYWADRSGCW